MSHPSHAEAVVQRQLLAYNRRDLDAFTREFTDDVLIYRMPKSEPSLSGKAALTAYYRDNRFNAPDLHAELVSRMVVGNKVVDHERITGLSDGVTELIAVYETTAAGISKAWFFSGE